MRSRTLCVIVRRWFLLKFPSTARAENSDTKKHQDPVMRKFTTKMCSPCFRPKAAPGRPCLLPHLRHHHQDWRVRGALPAGGGAPHETHHRLQGRWSLQHSKFRIFTQRLWNGCRRRHNSRVPVGGEFQFNKFHKNINTGIQVYFIDFYFWGKNQFAKKSPVKLWLQ